MHRAIKDLLCTSGLVLISCLIAFEFCTAAYGFDSDEHKALGDTTIDVVYEEYRCSQGSPRRDQNPVCDALEKIRISDSALSYGEVVACVDNYLTPEKLMASFETTNRGMISSWPTGGGRTCKLTPKKFAQASHSNFAHFEKELLVSLDTYHILAIGMAKDKDLEGALFVNAIADHYLEDFFAPSHVVVPRGALTDLFAMAIHNYADRTGATFHLTKSEQQRGLSAEMTGIQQLLDKECAAPSDRRLCKFLDVPDKERSEVVSTIYKNSQVHLDGDGYLFRRDGYEQRVFMLAANVRSVKDILEAYEGKEGAPNSFGEYHWIFQRSNGNFFFPPPPLIEADLPFGYYAFGPSIRANDKDRELPNKKDLVCGVSVGREFYTFKQRVARTATTVECVPWGRVGGGLFGNFGTAVGLYHYEGDGGAIGDGPSVRVAFIVPELESTISLGVRRVYHAGTAQDGWRNGVNLRFDQGFSSILSVYLSVGKDSAAQPAGPLAYGSYFAAGLMMAWPLVEAH